MRMVPVFKIISNLSGEIGAGIEINGQTDQELTLGTPNEINQDPVFLNSR